MSRFWALLLVTGRQDLLSPLMREIGAEIVIGEEVQTVRLGQLQQLISEAQAEMRALKGKSPKMRGDK